MPKRRKLNPSPSTERQRTLPKRYYTCPLCSNSIPTSDLAQHYHHELTQFQSQKAPERKRPAAVIALSKIVDRPRQKRTEVSNLLFRVRANRQKRRQNERISEIDGLNDGNEGIEECPVCGVCFVGIESTIYEHVSSCLDRRLQEEQQAQNEQLGIEEWVVYGHERAVDMLEGGIHSLPNTAVNSETREEEVDVFVDVEGDAEAVYGRTQYTEDDLKNPTRDGKVADVRCNICLNGYVSPVVSVQCFHVYCQGCWLSALRERKLCPQCRIITQPTDLRRVYL